MNDTPKKEKSWRISRRILIGLAILVTVIGAFYTEEDWRGKSAWEKCEGDLEARGAVLDWKAYVPPPVPDDQNAFAAPHMMEWFSKPNMKTSTAEGAKDSWHLGNTNTHAVITDDVRARDYLAWSDQFEPRFEEVRAALRRPSARINGDYARPFETPIANYFMLRSFAQVLAQRTKCFLLLAQPERALPELTLLYDCRRLAEAAPNGKSMLLVAAMIDTAISGLYVDTAANGLQKQTWREPQLMVLQNQLAELDLPALLSESLKSERAAACTVWQTAPTPKELGFVAMPHGWTYQMMTTGAEFTQNALARLDVTNHLIRPCEPDELFKSKGKSLLPYDSLAKVFAPNFTKAMQTVAHNQTMANEAQIVCALERYRLARGQYPDALDALAPQFMEKLPHDLIGGQPLHYRRENDGKFLLYSIGWNQKDDGGKEPPTDKPGEGDWVWKN